MNNMKKGMKNMWVGLLLLFTSLGLQAQEQGAERFNVEEVKPPPTPPKEGSRAPALGQTLYHPESYI